MKIYWDYSSLKILLGKKVLMISLQLVVVDVLHPFCQAPFKLEI